MLVVAEIVLVVVFAVLGFWVRVQPWFVADRIIHLVPLISSSSFRDYGYLHGNDPWIEYWIADRLWGKGLAYWSCLKPDCDMWTRLFWYPWGRDFTRSEYPLLPMFAAATYGFVKSSMSLQAWIALIPPLAGAFLVIASYVVGRLLFGRLAGVTAALLVAFLPANMDRTMAGFVEKEGFALPIVLLSIGLLCMALRMGDRKSVIASIIGGLVGGIAGFAWGGYRFTLIAAGLAGLFAPLFLRDSEKLKNVLQVVLSFIIVDAALLVFSPASSSGLRLAVVALLASIVGYVVWVGLERFTASKRVYVNVVRLYGCFKMVLLVAALGAVLAGILPFNFRALYALLWPIRSLFSFPPLVASVAEHYPPNMHMLVNELGIALVMAPLGVLLGLWDSYRRSDVGRAVMLLVSAGAYWAMLGMAYFLQSGGVFAAIATASLLSFFEARMHRKTIVKKKMRVSGLDELWKTSLILLVVMLMASASLAGYAEYNKLSHTATSILTGGAGLGVNPGWFVLLDVINITTPKDAVVVTWWDYGYWITVPTARATLADGATINATQISLLGRILTGSEQESSELMKKLGLKPGKTYVMVHEVVLVNETSGEVIFEPLFYRVDIPKSYWMLRIGGRDPANYFSSMIEDVGGGRKILMYTVDFGKKAVREALIYKMLVDAAYRLDDKIHVLTDLKIEKINKVVVPAKDNNNNMIRVVAPKPELKEFKPWKIIAYSFPPAVGKGLRPVLLIAFYQWTG